MKVVSKLEEGAVPLRATVVPTSACVLFLAMILTVSSRGIGLISVAGRQYFGLWSGLPTSLLAVAYALFAAVSYFNLKVLAQKTVLVAGLSSGLVFGLLLAAGVVVRSGPLFVAGIALFAVAFAWATFLFACCLVCLPSVRAAAVATVGGTVLWQFALFGLPPLDGRWSGPLILGAVCTAAIAGLTIMERDQLRRIGLREPLAAMELTNPLSALRVSPRLYGCVFLVSLTYYFSNSLGVPGMTARRLIVVVVLLALLYLLLIQREAQEDHLFSLVVFCIVAGLLIAPLMLDRDTFIAHTCMFLGARCFDILLWLVVYGLGVRNITVMLPFFGVAYGLNALGRLLGGILGTAAMAMVDSNMLSTQAVILGLALFFFGFIWLGFRDFSFTRAIRGVDAIEGFEPLHVTEQEIAGPSDWLENRCHALAEHASLTPRETEILELLARGRNAQFIMDTLVITRNTAKAHIRHVYTKLGIHSQQELLTLVEGTTDETSEGFRD